MNSHNTVSGQEVSSNRVTVWAFLLLILFFSDAHAGTALRLYYHNIPGDTVANLLSHPSFPASPAGTEIVSRQLERIERGGDNWGSWTRGYLDAPQTGKYTFFLASDNNTEFWLSTTHLPFQISKIMENGFVLSRHDYRVRSEPVELVQGEKYYFELYHKEGIGLDHVSVGWQLPDGLLERPIASHRLMPVPVDAKFQTLDKAPLFLTNYFSRAVSSLSNMTAIEGETILLEPTVEGTQPITFQWFRNNEPVPGENLSSLLLSNLRITQSETYRLVASNELGTATAETILNVVPDAVSIAMISALNLGLSNTIAVIFSKAVDPASATVPSNYELNNGAVVKSVKLAAKDTVHLTVSPLQMGKTCFVKARNVKDLPQRNVIAEQKPLEVDRGLNLWLQFDSKEDDVVPDSSGNFNSAVLINGAHLNQAGVLGSCLELDGVNDHAILPTGFANFTNGMTVALWAKPTGNGHWARFIDLGNGRAEQVVFFGRKMTSNSLVFETYTNDAAGIRNLQALVPDIISQDIWQHLVASLDARGVMSMYKDGLLVGKVNIMVPVLIQRTSNLIGRSNWDEDGHYKGFMDDLRIYDRALSATEVETLARSEKK